jgi:hypothetical protein
MTQVNTGPSEPCKAHYEAGHAVIADSLGYKVHLVTIVSDGPTNTQGRTEYDDPLGALSTLLPFALRVRRLRTGSIPTLSAPTMCVETTQRCSTSCRASTSMTRPDGLAVSRHASLSTSIGKRSKH